MAQAAEALIEWLGARPAPLRVALVLLPQFTLLPPMAMIEAMRQANLLLGRPIFEWQLLRPDDAGPGTQVSSSGVEMAAQGGLTSQPDAHLNLLCGGVATHAQHWPALSPWLRQTVAAGRAVGSLCTGAYALGDARLLDDRHCTVHWWNIGTLAETFPRAWVSRQWFIFDRGVLTCTGGVAPAHLVVSLVAVLAGHAAAAPVANHLLLDRYVDDEPLQPSAGEYAWHADEARIAQVVQVMETSTGARLDLAQLAAVAGTSVRQLERRIRQRFGVTPVGLYRRMRLRRARRLVLYTPARVQEIAAAQGFQSLSSFTRDYKAYFGLTPIADRRAFPRLFSLKGSGEGQLAALR